MHCAYSKYKHTYQFYIDTITGNIYNYLNTIQALGDKNSRTIPYQSTKILLLSK